MTITITITISASLLLLYTLESISTFLLRRDLQSLLDHAQNGSLFGVDLVIVLLIAIALMATKYAQYLSSQTLPRP